MIDTDEIDNMKQWTNDYKVRMFWDLVAEVKDLQKKLDNLRDYCHAEDYDIFNWEIKNIEVIE